MENKELSKISKEQLIEYIEQDSQLLAQATQALEIVADDAELYLQALGLASSMIAKANPKLFKNPEECTTYLITKVKAHNSRLYAVKGVH